MEAGRELDWLVMEKVMGRESCELTDSATFEDASNHVPEYSTDISAAFEIIEKLKTKLRKVELFMPFGDRHWVCWIKDSSEKVIGGSGGDSVALAICEAALAAHDSSNPKT